MMARAERRTGLSRSEFELVPRVRELPVPALIVHDVEDAEVPVSNAEAWARAWPGAELMKTQGLGHYRILRDREVVARTIRFISK